ncbi:MAG: IS1634 family transposase, partial [Verrucomicrobia bacterium]|nr:IS1634 family transposase [Verrucomicrobiota bacterium]
MHSTTQKKDGREHRYYSVVENVRVPERSSPFQKTLLYLGELSEAQQAEWNSAVKVFDTPPPANPSLNLFPGDPAAVVAPASTPSMSLRLDSYRLLRPRQYGACWMACELWRELELDKFWNRHLPPSRQGTDWVKVLT